MLGSMMFEGGEIIRERIKRYQIDCDYRPGGLFVAMNDKQLATLEEQKENWERYGNKQLELLDANAIRREVASDRYTGALLDHSGGHIHPLNLAIGEADAIRLNGGRVYELSAVTQIQHTTPAVVRTAKGQVTAKYVIVAGNAYLGDKVEPELAKRSMPCGTQVITTERLSEDLARSLIETTVWKTVTICLITTVLPPTTACCTAAAWSTARATRMTLSALWCRNC